MVRMSRGCIHDEVKGMLDEFEEKGHKRIALCSLGSATKRRHENGQQGFHVVCAMNWLSLNHHALHVA